MNGSTAAVLLIVLILLAAAGWHLYHKRGRCSSDCSSCNAVCSRRSAEGTPKWVEEYRKDHPKSVETDNKRP